MAVRQRGGACSIQDCGRPVMGYGWCGRHYQNWRRTGDPAKGRLELRPPRIKAGEKFGRLTVIEDVQFLTRNAPCRCECGAETSPRADGLLSGRVRSCGCLNRDCRTTHGLSSHPLYGTWMMMVHRTTNPKNADYANYGGRGIEVCPQWRHDPAVFIGWLLENLGPRPTEQSLDRINVNGNYEPGNLRWATDAEQVANRQLNEQLRLLTEENERLRAEVAALKAKVSVKTVTRARKELNGAKP